MFRSDPLPSASFFGKSSLSVPSKIMASLICLLEQDKKCVANIYEIRDNDMPRIS